MMSGFIAVHVGAGYHAESLRSEYKQTCKKACIVAIQKLKQGINAIEAVAEAVSILEDCPLTNAGIGSNLTLDRIVECDAAIMDGKSLNFGSVGALRNIRNPIKVAQRVLERQQKGLLSGGRIPPCTIVGTGAKEFALEQGFKFVDNRCLLTKTSESSYVKHSTMLKKMKSLTNREDGYSAIPKISECVEDNDLLDTVGAVCVDSSGNVASAVSSGGLLLKHSGRIGQAAVYGSGCWAENSSEYDKPNIACTATGVGEYLIKTLFARECSQMVYKDANSISIVPNVFKKKFLDNPCLQNVTTKLAGVLILKHFMPENYCELAWAHNTKTMILGYMSTTSEKPITVFSSQPSCASHCKNIVGSERCIKIASKS